MENDKMIEWEVWTNGHLIGHYETEENLMAHDVIKLNNKPYKIAFADKNTMELDVFAIY